MIGKFDQAFFEAMISKAQNSPRRRTHHNVHESYDDPVQRLFVAMLPDSYVRPHRHTLATKWEFFMVVRGEIDVILFDENGTVTDKITLTAGDDGQCNSLQIPPGTWHATVCRAPVVFFEVKQGPYLPEDDKNFATWAPAEGDASVSAFLSALKTSGIGDSIPALIG
ncbi:WbuC family cupin fold metalloprotein [Alteromonas sp. CYL-A6]|uniref:WbuC family cupin fold metalloprotein n=1 Tax=Alteromonas nitratireducens TaxID=3390813 RepID=UPI0034B12EAB